MALLGGAALAVSASLGQVLPVRGWLYDLVIPTRFFRHPSWFRAYPIFIFGLLALHGARDFAGLTAKNAARGHKVLMATAAVAALLAGAAYLAVLDLARPPNWLGGHVHFVLAWIVPALAVPWLAFLSSRRRGLVVAAIFGAIAVTDAVLTADLSSVTLGLSGEGPRQTWADIERRHRSETDLLRLDGAMRWVSPSGPYNNKSFLTRQAALLSYSGLRNVYHEQSVADPILVVAATTADRFWYSPAPVWLAPSDGAFSSFLARTHQLGAAPLVLHRPEQMIDPLAAAQTDEATLQQLRLAPAAQRVPVTFERYFPDVMALTVTVPADGWLMLTDRWARGWSARVDGAAVSVAGADFIFRGLPVHVGSNRIELRYRPTGYPWAPPALWGLVIVLLVASVWQDLPVRFRALHLRRRNGPRPGDDAGPAARLGVGG